MIRTRGNIDFDVLEEIIKEVREFEVKSFYRPDLITMHELIYETLKEQQKLKRLDCVLGMEIIIDNKLKNHWFVIERTKPGKDGTDKCQREQ